MFEMKRRRQSRPFARLGPALATGAAAAGANFLGVEAGLPCLVSVAGTFCAAVGLSLLLAALSSPRAEDGFPDQDVADGAGAPRHLEGQTPDETDARLPAMKNAEAGGESQNEWVACAPQLPLIDRLLEKTVEYNSSVTEETELAANDIIIQLNSLNISIDEIIDYLKESYTNVTNTVDKFEKLVEDNCNLVTNFLDRRRGDVVETEARLKRIENMAASLSGTTRSVRVIAGQTTMLALNATIEASRAGEFGPGFAVVASEVKALAQKSDQTAKEIGDGVESLRATIRDGIAWMRDSCTQAEQQELVSVKATIGELSKQTAELIAIKLEILNKVQSESQQVGNAVVALMSSIQFQDVTRQRLGYINTLSDLARTQLRQVSESLSSGHAKEMPAVEALRSALDEEGPSPPRSHVKGALVELF